VINIVGFNAASIAQQRGLSSRQQQINESFDFATQERGFRCAVTGRTNDQYFF
jgi:hypothetical protein